MIQLLENINQQDIWHASNHPNSMKNDFRGQTTLLLLGMNSLSLKFFCFSLA